MVDVHPRVYYLSKKQLGFLSEWGMESVEMSQCCPEKLLLGYDGSLVVFHILMYYRVYTCSIWIYIDMYIYRLALDSSMHYTHYLRIVSHSIVLLLCFSHIII